MYLHATVTRSFSMKGSAMTCILIPELIHILAICFLGLYYLKSEAHSISVCNS